MPFVCHDVMVLSRWPGLFMLALHFVYVNGLVQIQRGYSSLQQAEKQMNEAILTQKKTVEVSTNYSPHSYS